MILAKNLTQWESWLVLAQGWEFSWHFQAYIISLLSIIIVAMLYIFLKKFATKIRILIISIIILLFSCRAIILFSSVLPSQYYCCEIVHLPLNIRIQEENFSNQNYSLKNVSSKVWETSNKADIERFQFIRPLFSQKNNSVEDKDSFEMTIDSSIIFLPGNIQIFFDENCVRIQNLSPYFLQNAILIQGYYAYLLGNVAIGEEKTIPLLEDSQQNIYAGLSYSFPSWQNYPSLDWLWKNKSHKIILAQTNIMNIPQQQKFAHSCCCCIIYLPFCQ